MTPPIQTQTNKCTNKVFLALHKQSRKHYTDQTGKFPYKFNEGNKYFLILFVFNANAIIAEPIKNHTHQKWHNFLRHTVSNYASTNTTTKCLRQWNVLLEGSRHKFNTHLLTFTNKMQQREPFKHRRTTQFTTLPANQILPTHFKLL